MKSLEEQMAEILEDVRSAVDNAVDEALTDAPKIVKEQLTETSPERSGEYKSGWRVKRDRRNKSAVVYNAKAPHLTHLLENGHISRNQFGQYGRVPARKHIKPAEEHGIEVFERKIIEETEKGLK